MPVERLRFTPRSLAVAVALVAVGIAVLRVFDKSTRVLGWTATAAIIAGLLHRAVRLISGRMRRGFGVAIVAVTTLIGLVLFSYALVDDVTRQTHNLQQSAPRAARRLERSTGRPGTVARRVHLARATRRFVDSLPARLQGGTALDAARSAATRGAAFLATAVLTLFLLLHGPAIARSGIQQPRDPRRRRRVERVVTGTYNRASGYLAGSLAMSVVAGSLAFAVARLTGVPGPVALGVWVGLWDVVPLVGTAIGALPIVLLAASQSPSKAVIVACVLFGYQVVEGVVLQPRLERRSVRVGPFLTLAAGMLGVELYGIGGAIFGIVAATVAVSALEAATPEVAPAASATVAA